MRKAIRVLCEAGKTEAGYKKGVWYGVSFFPDEKRNRIKSGKDRKSFLFAADKFSQKSPKMNVLKPDQERVVFEQSVEPPEVPGYLHRVYWWAYEHPLAVRFWDHALLINLILLGNYSRLVKAVLDEFPKGISGNMLQISCAYGKLTPSLEACLNQDGRLDVIDVLPVQLDNVRRKLASCDEKVRLIQCDATKLDCPDASYDQALMFFLPHELPETMRRRALAEAVRVVRPGGKIILVDFHRPAWWHPFRWWQRLVFWLFEPFAMDMWRHDLTSYLPGQPACSVASRQTYFGGLYQKLVLVRKAD